MDRAIAVLNEGSSSLKFSIFLDHSGELQLLFRGQAGGLFTSPRFLVRDQAGATVAETECPAGTRLGHEGAIEHLFHWAAEVKARLGGQRLDRPSYQPPDGRITGSGRVQRRDREIDGRGSRSRLGSCVGAFVDVTILDRRSHRP